VVAVSFTLSIDFQRRSARNDRKHLLVSVPGRRGSQAYCDSGSNSDNNAEHGQN